MKKKYQILVVAADGGGTAIKVIEGFTDRKQAEQETKRIIHEWDQCNYSVHAIVIEI